MEFGEPTEGGGNYWGSRSVWYRWQAVADGGWSVTTDGSDFDTNLGIYTGTTVSALTKVAWNDDNVDTATSRDSILRFDAEAGVEYHFLVRGWENTTGSVKLNWGPTPENDNYTNATPVGGLFGSADVNNCGASRESGEPSSLGSRSIWYSWEAPASGLWTFGTISSTFDTWMGIYTGDELTNLVLLASNDDAGSTETGSSITINANQGSTYSVAVDGKYSAYDHTVGDIALHWFPFAPQIVRADIESTTNLTFALWTTYGTNYQAQWRQSLLQGEWLPLTNFVGSGLLSDVRDEMMTATQMFYRVVIP